MDLGRRWEATVIAERQFDARISDVASTQDGGWLVSFRDHPDVVLLDTSLREVQRLDLHAQWQQECATTVARSHDGQLFGVSSRSDLRIVTRHGNLLQRIANSAWEPFTGSGCVFDTGHRLWYVRPGSSPGRGDRLSVVEPRTGAILAQQPIKLPRPPAHYHLYLCPDQASVVLDAACGQDGSWLYRAHLAGRKLRIRRYPFSDRVFTGGFAPGGQEFVTGAHDGDAAKIHAFPGGQVLASAASASLFAADHPMGNDSDAVGYHACYLDADHLLLDTSFGRMLLLERDPMRLLGTVWPPGGRLRGYDSLGRETDDPAEIEDHESGLTGLYPAGAGRALTVYEGKVLRLLALPILW